MNSSYSPAARPRLTPGIPMGGIAALAVTVAVVAGSALLGDPLAESGVKVRTHVSFEGRVPPIPPIPPVAPFAPLAPLPPGATVDPAEIARTVEEAMRGIDHAEIARTVEEALRGVDHAEIARTVAQTLREQAEAARMEAQRRRDEVAALRSRMQASAPADGGGALAANFDARALRLVQINGDVTIEVGRRDNVRIEVESNANALRTSVADGRLTIVGGGDGAPPVELRVLVPHGADLTLAALTGDVTIGGRELGDLSVELLRGSVTADAVRSASVTVHETGDVTIGRVDGPLRFSAFGSGELTVDRAGDTYVGIPGTGNVTLGRTAGLTLSIHGQGEVNVDRVDGPVNTAFLGAGTVRIGDGRADPLRVAVTGSGEFHFDGVAHDPVVLADGTGTVHVARHTGKSNVRNAGQGKAWVGD